MVRGSDCGVEPAQGFATDEFTGRVMLASSAPSDPAHGESRTAARRDAFGSSAPRELPRRIRNW